jgi:xyloglucan fucosyltransferase
MVMGRPSNSHGSGGDEERLPLRGVLETQQRAPGTPPPPPVHHAAEQLKEARRGGSRLWRASVRAGLLLCLLTVPAVLLLLLRWQADSSPQWVFDFEAPEEDDDQGTRIYSRLLCVYTIQTIRLCFCSTQELCQTISPYQFSSSPVNG